MVGGREVADGAAPLDRAEQKAGGVGEQAQRRAEIGRLVLVFCSASGSPRLLGNGQYCRTLRSLSSSGLTATAIIFSLTSMRYALASSVARVNSSGMPALLMSHSASVRSQPADTSVPPLPMRRHDTAEPCASKTNCDRSPSSVT